MAASPTVIELLNQALDELKSETRQARVKVERPLEQDHTRITRLRHRELVGVVWGIHPQWR